MRVGRTDGGDSMAFVQRLLAREEIFDRETHRLGRAFTDLRDAIAHRREVGGRDDCLDARQSQRLRGVDAFNDGVGVGTALDASEEHAGEVKVGAVLRPTCDLVGAIVADRPRADHFVVFCRYHLSPQLSAISLQ
jgi:hypothetical protein